MNKEFVPYIQALALKELEFNESCFGYYTGDKMHLVIRPLMLRANELESYVVTAPTFSQAFRWFREKKLADGSVCRHGTADGSYSYRWDIVYEYGVYEERHFKQDYKTYEEAELACLEKLIEIVDKTKQYV